MDRRKFISLSGLAGISVIYSGLPTAMAAAMPFEKDYIVTVNGRISLNQLGSTLAHEHFITDFAGAEKNRKPIYTNEEATSLLLPYLTTLKKSGISSVIECTPAYIGRNVALLKSLSIASGLHVITNTGYYSAVGQKYLPEHAFTETAGQIANRWLNEWHNGIEGTGIRPGFIKLGVDNGPLKEIEKKMIRAAAITHAESGLKIFIHTGDAKAAKEEVSLLASEGLTAEAMVWVHAQNDTSGEMHVELARKGCWISLDGVNERPEALEKYTRFIVRMKNEKLLHKVLLSHDDGFSVEKLGKKTVFNAYNNGNTYPYRSLSTTLGPKLIQHGISPAEFNSMLTENPVQALQIKICKAL